jgi:hypothetical protein
MNEDDTKKAAQRARDSLQKGFTDLFRAAGSAASVVKGEAKKSFEALSPKRAERSQRAEGGLGKAVDGAGREVVRAAAEVATFLGSSLSSLGKRAEEALHQGDPNGADAAGNPVGDETEEWPKTREEYERRYGRDGDDWPKSREEYERKYGRPPRKRGDDDDPGFRIA